LIKLRIIQAGQPPEEVTIDRDIAVIGRDYSCDVPILQPYVSKRHLRILRGVVIVDLGSSNGTFVDGERVYEATLVTNERVNLGHEQVAIEILSGRSNHDSSTADSDEHEAGAAANREQSAGGVPHEPIRALEHKQEHQELNPAETIRNSPFPVESAQADKHGDNGLELRMRDASATIHELSRRVMEQHARQEELSSELARLQRENSELRSSLGT